MDEFTAAFQQYQTRTFRQDTAQRLVDVGALFGDEETLMRAKAERLCEMLRRIIEDIPDVLYTAKLPENLSSVQAELVRAAISRAALKGAHRVVTYALQCISDSMYDLCTSKLAARPNA